MERGPKYKSLWKSLKRRRGMVNARVDFGGQDEQVQIEEGCIDIERAVLSSCQWYRVGKEAAASPKEVHSACGFVVFLVYHMKSDCC